MKNQISPHVAFKSGTYGLAQNAHGSHIVLPLSIRLWQVGILVSTKKKTRGQFLKGGIHLPHEKLTRQDKNNLSSFV